MITSNSQQKNDPQITPITQIFETGEHLQIESKSVESVDAVRDEKPKDNLSPLLLKNRTSDHKNPVSVWDHLSPHWE